MKMCLGYNFLFFLIILFFQGITVFAQNQVIIEGYVLDKQSNTPLPGAIISVAPAKSGTASDINGHFKIHTSGDTLEITVEYLGFKPYKTKLSGKNSFFLNIHMTEEDQSLDEVIVEGTKPLEGISAAQMSVVSIDSKDAKQIPVFFGEIDLLKTLQLKPGILGGNEGSSGLFVRGGGPDQNLILMDNAVVYNPAHLLGFFSLFNPDIVTGVDLYKGDFPARFGGRLSSVVDLKLGEGSKEKYEATGGIGLISSRLSIGGPIQKKKSSFVLSGRRTYLDLYTPTINKINKNNKNFDPIPAYFFYDLNGKIDIEITPKDKISFSGYFGKDVLDLSTSHFNSMLKWGNIVSSLRWNHVFNSKFFLNTTASYSQYHYSIDYRFNIFSNTLKTMISDYSIKNDFQYYANDKHILKFGSSITFNRFNIGRVKTSNDGKISLGEGNVFNATSGAIYISDEININARWKLNLGGRYTFFLNDSSFFSGPEPRLSVRYLINNNLSLKTSLSRMYQYIHLASNSGASLPNDIWFPSTQEYKPQRSDLAALGINLNLFGGKYTFSNEVYYKWMARQIDIKEGAAIFDLPNIQEGFTVGKGWAYGNEFYLEKKHGKTTGWIGYTLSWTWRQFDDINGGEKFPARYDRRHNVAIVMMHIISERLLFSASWTFSSGNAVTLPIGRFAFQDMEHANRDYVPQFMARNSFRMPSVHRLDLGIVYKLRPKKGEADLTFSIYNAYSRRNAYFIYFEGIPNAANTYIESFRAKQVSLFPVIPSISYNFKF